MLRNRVEFLSAAEVEQVHDVSMALLSRVGVRFPDDEAMGVFREHGVRTEGSAVFLEEREVMEALGRAPAQFTIHARNPERRVTVGDGGAVFTPGYGAPFLVDVESGKRTPTMADYVDLVRLADALPNQDLSGHLMVEPGDVPPADAHLRMLHASMVHSDKPFIGSTEGAAGARHTLEMAAILFGGELERPVTLGLINPLSPLGYSGEMLQALMTYAQARQPVVIATMALAGSTAPITLAGMIAQQSAEILAGVTLAQLVSPGTPVVYGSTSTNVHMRTGSPSIGSPELALVVTATAQMARRYGLPSRGGGALTDAHTSDAQAGYESMMGMLTAVNSGMDLVVHSAGMMSSYLAFSYEKFVLDDEMCGMVRRYRRGVTVTPETLAGDLVAKVGPGGNFLTERHTVRRCRSEFWQPEVWSRADLQSWQDAGCPGVAEGARQRWQRLLAAHEDPPLDGVVARQLEEYVEEHCAGGGKT